MIDEADVGGEAAGERYWQSECGRVTRWRWHQLVQAGYERELALLLALDSAVDLHRAVDLLSAGCPPDTALRILS